MFYYVFYFDMIFIGYITKISINSLSLNLCTRIHHCLIQVLNDINNSYISPSIYGNCPTLLNYKTSIFKSIIPIIIDSIPPEIISTDIIDNNFIINFSEPIYSLNIDSTLSNNYKIIGYKLELFGIKEGCNKFKIDK